ncbi:hypothetical protein [Tenacibaculum geojense]|uniref:hypothetical protein n=1 Tax=Tenacibaculum geojense TaxID=915352 RepID=UPI0036D9017D
MSKQIAIIILLSFLVSCKVTKRATVVNGTYTFERHESKSRFSSINVEAYDYEYKNGLNAGVTVNDVYFDIKFDKEKKIIPLQIKASPNNKFNVRVLFPSRHSVKIDEFYFKRGDSIIIKAYLKEDNRPVY